MLLIKTAGLDSLHCQHVVCHKFWQGLVLLCSPWMHTRRQVKVDCEEGPTYPRGIKGCWPVANEVEVTEMETTITSPIPGKCI